jgi:hypothetical protein
MNFDNVVNNLSRSVDPGAVLQQELEEAISPITGRVDKLEKKIDMLILLMKSIDDNLKKLQPLYDLTIKLPFFKK